MNHSTTRFVARVCAALVAVMLVAAPAIAKKGGNGKGPGGNGKSQAAAHRKNDRDHMPNGWEKKHGLNPQVDDSQEDPDADLLVNIDEYAEGTDPQNADTDGDGVSDGQEVLDETDPTDAEDFLVPAPPVVPPPPI